jgi:hypothetical protein
MIAKARMTEPCHLTAVEARRLIGQKLLAPAQRWPASSDSIETESTRWPKHTT